MSKNSEVLVGFRNILKYYDSLRRRVCKQHSLSQTEFDVLAFLGNNPGLDTARDIVELRMLQEQCLCGGGIADPARPFVPPPGYCRPAPHPSIADK